MLLWLNRVKTKPLPNPNTTRKNKEKNIYIRKFGGIDGDTVIPDPPTTTNKAQKKKEKQVRKNNKPKVDEPCSFHIMSYL